MVDGFFNRSNTINISVFCKAGTIHASGEIEPQDTAVAFLTVKIS